MIATVKVQNAKLVKVENAAGIPYGRVGRSLPTGAGCMWHVGPDCYIYVGLEGSLVCGSGDVRRSLEYELLPEGSVEFTITL